MEPEATEIKSEMRGVQVGEQGVHRKCERKKRVTKHNKNSYLRKIRMYRVRRRK